jgi:hypothetical protein
MGVEPRNATAHRAMTRPRIDGDAVSCSVLLPVDWNATLIPPTTAMAPSSTGSDGAAAARASAAPNSSAFLTIAVAPVRPLPATSSPPTTAPAPMAAVMRP